MLRWLNTKGTTMSALDGMLVKAHTHNSTEERSDEVATPDSAVTHGETEWLDRAEIIREPESCYAHAL